MTLVQLDKFVLEIIRFERCVTGKLPDGLWNRTVHVSGIDDVELIIDSSYNTSVNGEKEQLRVNAAEILLLTGDLLNLKYEFVKQSETLNAIDRYFFSVISVFLKQTENNTASERYSIVCRPDARMRKLLLHCRELYDACNRNIPTAAGTHAGIAGLFERRSFQTGDGYDMDYFICGKKSRPVLVLINAYGISKEIWSYVAYHFSDKYRIITWETRGTLPEYSGMRLDNRVHSEDLLKILEQEKVVHADFFCWCSGFKIMAEFYRLCPEKVRTISAICGYFNPVESGIGMWTEFDRTIGRLSDMIVKDEKLIENPNFFMLIEKLFCFNITASKSSIEKGRVPDKLLENLIGSAGQKVKDIITAPFRTKETLQSYAQLTLNLQGHDVSDILPALKCPVLIINAGRDIIADARCAEIASTRIKNCRYVYLPHATHWCLWEDYGEVDEVLESFLYGAS